VPSGGSTTVAPHSQPSSVRSYWPTRTPGTSVIALYSPVATDTPPQPVRACTRVSCTHVSQWYTPRCGARGSSGGSSSGMSSVTSSAVPRASRTSFNADNQASACSYVSRTSPPPGGSVCNTTSATPIFASSTSGSYSERSAAAESRVSLDGVSGSILWKSGNNRPSTGSSGPFEGPVRMPVSSASSSCGASSARAFNMSSTWLTRPRSTAASCCSNPPTTLPPLRRHSLTAVPSLPTGPPRGAS